MWGSGLALALTAGLAAALTGAQAQHADQRHGDGHGAGSAGGAAHAPAAASPREPGEAAFAAIAEVVARLRAEPETDWSRVDVAALRRHLIDMSNVTLRARVEAQDLPGGARFRVWSPEPDVADSIRRMTLAHARTMDGAGGWRMEAEPREDGAVLEVRGEAADAAQIRALGFVGGLTVGMHHQAHHLAIATGRRPHGE
ncbi:MAG: hypothetical protein ACQEUZ_05590 [Pseudomonadota bacterium]